MKKTSIFIFTLCLFISNTSFGQSQIVKSVKYNFMVTFPGKVDSIYLAALDGTTYKYGEPPYDFCRVFACPYSLSESESEIDEFLASGAKDIIEEHSSGYDLSKITISNEITTFAGVKSRRIIVDNTEIFFLIANNICYEITCNVFTESISKSHFFRSFKIVGKDEWTKETTTEKQKQDNEMQKKKEERYKEYEERRKRK